MSAVRGDRGSVLLYVVWAITLLSLFAVSVGAQAGSALRLTDRLSAQLRASAIARSAVQYAHVLLELDDTQTVDSPFDGWADNAGVFMDKPVGDGAFTVRAPAAADGSARYGLTDEDRKVSLNGAPAELLQGLFETAGELREDEAEALAQAVEDWRDEDDHERDHGAEGIHYRSLSQGYECKNGPFENVEEFLLIRGVTVELYRKLEPHLTAHGSGRLNLNTASPETLRALGLSITGLDGLLAYRAGNDGALGTPDDLRLVSAAGLHAELERYVPLEDLARLGKFADDGAIGVGSESFRLAIDASLGRPGTGVKAVCIMDRRGRVEQWTEQ